MKPRAWFRFANSTSEASVVDIHVTDIIGDWIDELINEYWGMKATLTAKAFIKQLSELDASVKAIRVHINSPGGDVFAAVTIANALRDQQLSKGRSVDTIVTGLAASAASIIAMAGKTVTMADNALMMIHKPLTGLWGNAIALRAAADELDTIELNAIVQTYKWHTNLEDDAIKALLTGANGVDGTWMGADEAIDKGFATAKVEGLQAAASIDRRVMNGLTVPAQFKARVDELLQPEAVAPQAANATEVLDAVQAAGLTLTFGRELVAAALPMTEVTARIAAEKATVSAATARATEIRTLCKTANLEELADGYIADHASVATVRAHLVTIAAKASPVIDASLLPAQEARRTNDNKLSAAAIYAERNKSTKSKE